MRDETTTGEAGGVLTLLDSFKRQVLERPDALATLHLEDGVTHRTTWRQWRERSQQLAAGLLVHGLAPGGRVAILSRTRVELAWVDVAVMYAGGISVPIFPTELPQHCARILNDSGAQLVVAENPWQLKKLVDIADEVDKPLDIILIDDVINLANGSTLSAAEFGLRAGRVTSFEQLMAQGRGPGARRLLVDVEPPRGDACVSICYTPGTEGEQKGVMVTHDNLVAASEALAAALPIAADDLQLMYLPLAQAFARTTLAVSMHVGFATAFARSYRTVFEDCASFQPTFLCGVPRLFEKAVESTDRALKSARGVKGLLASWTGAAAGGGGPFDDDGWIGTMRRDAYARMVRGELRKLFGKRLRFAVSGGAPLSEETARRLIDHGISVIEGYGTAETCAASHVDDPDEPTVGSVGVPVPGVEVRLLDDGEVCLRGPNVSPGYWGAHGQLRALTDAEGYFHTGDLGAIDDVGRLRITDRKRDIIVTANGKVIAPAPIVKALRADPLIRDAHVHGDRRTFLSALITLDADALAHFASTHQLTGGPSAWTRAPATYAAIETSVDRVNADLAPHENIKKFAILESEPRRPDSEGGGDERIRMPALADRHRALLESFYTETF